MTVASLTQPLIAAAVCWPLFAALLAALRYFFLPRAAFADVWRSPWFACLWMSASLPALAVAFTVQEETLHLSWLMMGGVWQTHGIRGPMLGFTAFLWLAASVFAHGYLKKDQADKKEAGRRIFRFALFWPLAMAGNFLLIVAVDIPGFYAGFVAMTFSAYVLVVHKGDREARRGAAAYIFMAVIGEALVIAGLLFGAGITGTTMLPELQSGLAVSPLKQHISFALWLGFGVKAGVAGLHVWLPLAHPVAPTPASAVLSGVMIKAGFLGWLFTLPVGMASLPAVGYAAMTMGLAGVFGAVFCGVVQRDPKVVLAYSSVSQIGVITALFGLALLKPSLWAVSAPVLVLFAIHHGLCKGALFLGTAITRIPPRLPNLVLWTALALPALSLAGIAGIGVSIKWLVKAYLYENELLFFLSAFTLTGMGTAFLMARLLFLQYLEWRRAVIPHSNGIPLTMVISWMACVLASTTIPWWLYTPPGLELVPPGDEIPGVLWPGMIGGLISLFVFTVTRKTAILKNRKISVPFVPAGDLWLVYTACARAGQGIFLMAMDRLAVESLKIRKIAGSLARDPETVSAWLEPGETFFRVWAGALMAIIALILAWVLFLSA